MGDERGRWDQRRGLVLLAAPTKAGETNADDKTQEVQQDNYQWVEACPPYVQGCKERKLESDGVGERHRMPDTHA